MRNYNLTLDIGPVQWKSSMNKKSLYLLLARFKQYSLLGWYRYFRLKIRGKKAVVTGCCLMCGRCCRKISLEAGGRWLRKATDYERVLKVHPEYGRFVPMGRDSQGFLVFSCAWCRPEGICRDHANRLAICRNFPDIDLYFSGGELPGDCGFTFKEIVPFASILSKELVATDAKKKPNSRD